MINTIKDIAIIADFVISLVASYIKGSNPKLAGTLFSVSAVVLLVAVVCAILSLIFKKRKDK